MIAVVVGPLQAALCWSARAVDMCRAMVSGASIGTQSSAMMAVAFVYAVRSIRSYSKSLMMPS